MKAIVCLCKGREQCSLGEQAVLFAEGTSGCEEIPPRPEDALQWLQANGKAHYVVEDLCQLLSRGPEAWPRDCGELVVLACYPRALAAMFEGQRSGQNHLYVNLRQETDCRPLLGALSLEEGGKTCLSMTEESGSWFPVIDRQRCIDCGQCLDYCLFGVYEKSTDGKIAVGNPDACKPGCPACSRICPQAAIIFPKYNQSPFQGDEVPQQFKQEQPEAIKSLNAEILRQRLAQKNNAGV